MGAIGDPWYKYAQYLDELLEYDDEYLTGALASPFICPSFLLLVGPGCLDNG